MQNTTKSKYKRDPNEKTKIFTKFENFVRQNKFSSKQCQAKKCYKMHQRERELCSLRLYYYTKHGKNTSTKCNLPFNVLLVCACVSMVSLYINFGAFKWEFHIQFYSIPSYI